MKILPRQQDPFLQRLTDPLFDENCISVWIQRLDLIHDQLSGNKWYKLSGNLDEIQRSHQKPTVITFGGAFSNHLYSTAAACSLLNIPSVGIVRGEIPEPLNSTLAFCNSVGMELIPVSRTAYRDKAALSAKFSEKYSNAAIIPEGGTNRYAVEACADIPDQKMKLMDYVCIPAGTGGTMAGVIGGLNPGQKVLGFSALKGDFLEKDVRRHIALAWPDKEMPDWTVNTQYHMGGYARHNPELIGFIQGFYRQYGILLDPVYTSKMMFGLMDLIRMGYFEEGSSICAIHTGGLQGWNGFTERFGIDPATF